MVIRFAEMDEKTLEGFYGGKGSFCPKMYVDGNNKILRGRLPVGSSTGAHRHEPTSEIIFILSGKGRAVCDGVEELLLPGDCHYCPQGSEHFLENIGEEDLLFYAVVPRHD
jgi:mannose-6-phosphate isomerase-like protein (cupin superfamily)